MGKLIFLWCVPRGRSTALLRVLTNRENTIGYFEPFHNIATCGPEKATPGPAPAMEGVLYDIDPELTIENFVKNLNQDLEKGDVVVKDFGFSAKHYLDKLPLENAIHVFLIRHPFLCGLSWLNTFKKIEPAHLKLFMQFEAGLAKTGVHAFSALHNLHTTLTEKGLSTIVISATDALEKPVECVKYICEHAGIEFDEKMLSWEGTGEFPANWRVSGPARQKNEKLHFIDGLLNSTGIIAGKEVNPQDIKPEDHNPNPQQKARFEDMAKHYIELQKHVVKFD